MFHILQSSGLVFLAMSDSSFERRIAYSFLDEIKTRFWHSDPRSGRPASDLGAAQVPPKLR
jgi:hypothetical protein